MIIIRDSPKIIRREYANIRPVERFSISKSTIPTNKSTARLDTKLNSAKTTFGRRQAMRNFGSMFNTITTVNLEARSVRCANSIEKNSVRKMTNRKINVTAANITIYRFGCPMANNRASILSEFSSKISTIIRSMVD